MGPEDDAIMREMLDSFRAQAARVSRYSDKDYSALFNSCYKRYSRLQKFPMNYHAKKERSSRPEEGVSRRLREIADHEEGVFDNKIGTYMTDVVTYFMELRYEVDRRAGKDASVADLNIYTMDFERQDPRTVLLQESYREWGTYRDEPARLRDDARAERGREIAAKCGMSYQEYVDEEYDRAHRRQREKIDHGLSALAYFDSCRKKKELHQAMGDALKREVKDRTYHRVLPSPDPKLLRQIRGEDEPQGEPESRTKGNLKRVVHEHYGHMRHEFDAMFVAAAFLIAFLLCLFSLVNLR